MRKLWAKVALCVALVVTPTAVGADPAAAAGGDDEAARQLKAAATAQVESIATPDRDGDSRIPRAARSATPDGPTECQAKRPTGKQIYTVCIGANDARPKVSAGAPGQSLRIDGKSAGVAAVDVIELPQFCIDNAFTGWKFTRTQACAIYSRIATIFNTQGAIVGTVEYLEINFSYTSATIATWAQQIELRRFGGTGVGNAPGTLAQGFALCAGGACTNARSDFPPEPLKDGSDASGEAFFDTTVTAAGDVRFGSTEFNYTFINPTWLPLNYASAAPPRVRCDNSLPGVAKVGCVFSDYTPVMEYSRNGSYPELARHIEEAQDSGLPGKYGTDRPVTRLTDQKKRDANGDQACPRRYKRPETKSCDEYPPRSTYEGASTTPNPGPARTFDWCTIPEPTGITGPNGYSVCMIDAGQNSQGGSALGVFYNDNRVIDQDPYFFSTPANGGGEPEPADHAPVASAGRDVTGREGEQVTLAGSATDDHGPPDVQWSYRPGSDVDPGAVCTFGDYRSATTTIRCTDDGTYTVTISAADGVQDFPSTDEATVTLSNVAPGYQRRPGFAKAGADQQLGIVSPTPWQLFRIGTGVALSTGFQDPGENDTQTCAIAWDDGTTSAGKVSDGLCEGTHVFQRPGMFTIKPTVADDDGGVSEATSVMVIVYDPRGDWADANGSYDSPAGALTSSPNITGQGWFHLTGRYYPQDDTKPQGAARSWLPDTDYQFDTTGSPLDWLIVTPDGKVAAKGSGILAGHEGRYGFVFYGYDGCSAGGRAGACQPGADQFRAVVWPLSAGPNPGTATVYDNRPSAGYDVDVVQPATLRTGHVLIQRPG